MSDKQKKVVDVIEQAIGNMPEFDQGYILGKSEAYLDKKRKEQMQDENPDGDGE